MWVITREAASAATMVEALAARGVPAVALPCLAFESRPWPADLPADATVVVTSPRVAASVSLPGRYAALAPASAQKLLERGINPVLTAEGGAEALAARIVAAGLAGPFLYPTSDRGAETDEQARAVAILSRIGEVRRFIVFALRAADGIAAGAASFGSVAWSFLSPSAVDALFDALVPAPAVAVLCHGTSTAAAYARRRPPSWPDALVSHGDPVAAICRLEGR